MLLPFKLLEVLVLAMFTQSIFIKSMMLTNHLKVLSLELFVKLIIKLSVSLNQTKMVILPLVNC